MGKEDEWRMDEDLGRCLYHHASIGTEKNNKILSQDATAGKNSKDTKYINTLIETLFPINAFLHDIVVYS
jgi:hypothetical protein